MADDYIPAATGARNMHHTLNWVNTQAHSGPESENASGA